MCSFKLAASASGIKNKIKYGSWVHKLPLHKGPKLCHEITWINSVLVHKNLPVWMTMSHPYIVHNISGLPENLYMCANLQCLP